MRRLPSLVMLWRKQQRILLIQGLGPKSGRLRLGVVLKERRMGRIQ
jgi:hypothetical protein